ncbi:MAG: hypothetical protein P1P88_04450 [Bacteroidales bacterium]|nr:hypothetical protein [Bacteroidales bacterium]
MNKYFQKTASLIFIICISVLAFAQKFSEQQEKILNEEALKIAKSYSDLFQSIANMEISDEEKVSMVKSWYNNRNVSLFNNIKTEDSRVFIPVDEYIRIIREDYPAGIIIKTELIDTTNIKPGLLKKAGAKLHIAVPIKISITGIYKGNRIIKNKHNIYLLYSFAKQGKTGLGNFKFEKLLLQNDLFPLEDYLYYNLGLLVGGNISMLSADNEIFTIKSPSEPAPQFGISFYKSFSKFFGISTGLVYKQFRYQLTWSDGRNVLISSSGDYKIDENQPQSGADLSNYLFKDKDNDDMVPFISTSGINDLRKINLLEVPVALEIKKDKPGSFSLYLLLGLQFTYKLSSKIAANGSYTLQGYYPDYNFTLHDLPDYGYITTDLDSSYSVKNKSFGISPYLATGIKIHVSKNIGLNLQLFATMPQKDLWFEYKNNTGMHSFAPEYAVEDILKNQLHLENPPAANQSWIGEIETNATFNFGIDFGIFYKF